MISNHPHDSICGCSVDPVHDEMVIRSYRFPRALVAVEKKAAQAVYAGVEKTQIARFFRALNMFADPQLNPSRLIAFSLSQDEVSARVRFQWAEDMVAHASEKAEAASASMQIRSSPALTMAGFDCCQRLRSIDARQAFAGAVGEFADCLHARRIASLHRRGRGACGEEN